MNRFQNLLLGYRRFYVRAFQNFCFVLTWFSNLRNLLLSLERNYFSFLLRKIIIRFKRIGYNLNVMRQSACLIFNPIMGIRGAR